MRSLSGTERQVICWFAERVEESRRRSVLRDLENATAEDVDEGDDRRVVRFHIDGYVHPPYRGERPLPVDAVVLDADGAKLSIAVSEDENGRLFELDLIRYDPGPVLGPDWTTLRIIEPPELLILDATNGTQLIPQMTRLPIWFAITGAVLKALLIVGWRVSGSARVFQLLTIYDPVSFWLAEVAVSRVFGGRRIAPSPAESLTFEVFLVLGSPLQCLVLGIVVQSILRVLNRGRKEVAMSRADDIVYEQANALLVQFLPELKEAVAHAYEYASPDVPGPHTLYDEVLNPYINKLVDANLETDEALERVFGFIERLSASTDKNVRDIVIATILAHLIGEPRLALARRYMGPATRRLLKKAQQ